MTTDVLYDLIHKCMSEIYRLDSIINMLIRRIDILEKRIKVLEEGKK